MSYPLLIKPEAELDIQDAYQYYEESQLGLGSEFVRAIDACFAKIGRSPLAYPMLHKQIRRALIRKFPYGVFYILEDNRVVVIACLHARREPIQWQDRGQ